MALGNVLSSFRDNAAGLGRKLALATAMGAALLASFPAAAQQATLKPQPAALPIVKVMSKSDCGLLRDLFMFEVEHYGTKLSDEFMDDWSKYIKNKCMGIVDGKPLKLRILTVQDDDSAAKIERQHSQVTKVRIKDTGIQVDYPKGTPTADSSAPRPTDKRSDAKEQ
jgi:hypothetical protein